MRNIYLDNTATSWPKPPTVSAAISDYLNNYGGSPGRSGHRFALKAGRQVFEAREMVQEFFNVPDSDRVVFTANSTHALNLAIKGILKPGDHVITTSMEHNSVIRPLRHLEKTIGIEITILQCNKMGELDPVLIKNAIKPNTKMVITIHGSNVLGSVFPVAEIGSICRGRNVFYLVDAAQTAGYLPIDMQKDNIDILTFTGHKKLYGPPGLGGLCFQRNVDIATMIHGGSGSRSELDVHPDFYPDKLEAGTMNTVGIVGLKAGMEYVMNQGFSTIQSHVGGLAKYFADKLRAVDEVTIYGPSFDNKTPGNKRNERLPVISVNVDGIENSELALQLDRDYNVMIRVGLHCAPNAHKTIGTFPGGTARFGFGSFNRPEDVDTAVDAIKKIVRKLKK